MANLYYFFNCTAAQYKKRRPWEEETIKFKMAVYSAMERFSFFQRLVVHYQLKIPHECF